MPPGTGRNLLNHPSHFFEYNMVKQHYLRYIGRNYHAGSRHKHK